MAPINGVQDLVTLYMLAACSLRKYTMRGHKGARIYADFGNVLSILGRN